MFRDFLPRNEDFLLDDLFSRANMPLTLMRKVPFHDNTTRTRKEHEKDYLRLLKGDWCIV
jgi:hypothetical protein